MTPIRSNHSPDMLTRHAKDRMSRRRIRMTDINAALDFGRRVHTRGAEVFVVGNREVKEHRAQGVDLEPFRGVHVVVVDGTVVTTYRNRSECATRGRGRSR